MAKEAICALLAILEHFFEAFSSIDLFFALAPFRSASSASPCFPPSRSFIDSYLFHLPPVRSSQHHPGLVPIPLGDIRPCCLHLPSFCRLVSPRLSPPAPSCLSLQPLQRLRLPVSIRPCRPRAVRTRGVFTHRDDFGKSACVERGLVRTAMFHGPTDVPRMGAPVMERAGSSGNAENGSHLAGADAAESHAGQVASSGSSGNAENGSHLAGADAAESHAGQVDSPGSSGNARIGSHLAGADAAESHAGQVASSGMSGNTENGSHLEAEDVAEGHAG